MPASITRSPIFFLLSLCRLIVFRIDCESVFKGMCLYQTLYGLSSCGLAFELMNWEDQLGPFGVLIGTLRTQCRLLLLIARSYGNRAFSPKHSAFSILRVILSSSVQVTLPCFMMNKRSSTSPWVTQTMKILWVLEFFSKYKVFI